MFLKIIFLFFKLNLSFKYTIDGKKYNVDFKN